MVLQFESSRIKKKSESEQQLRILRDSNRLLNSP
jgi:hypothetical protein